MKTNSQTPDNEVARLREQLTRVIQIAEIVGWTRQTTYLAEMKQELHKIKEEAQLAPAPEEPVSDWKCPHCGSTTGTWFSRIEPMGDICEDCGRSVDEEPAPEWRELGTDEVIGASDEYNPASRGEMTKEEMEKWESDVEKTIPHILDFGKVFKDHHEYVIGLERELQDAKNKSASAYMELEKAMARMMEIKMKQASLIAAVNTAITEFPSNQASIYLSGIMANLFQK